MSSETIVNKNYEELFDAISWLETNQSAWDSSAEESDAKMKEGFENIEEIRRLLQNYLSSIYFLIEHTRKMRN